MNDPQEKQMVRVSKITIGEFSLETDAESVYITDESTGRRVSMPKKIFKRLIEYFGS